MTGALLAGVKAGYGIAIPVGAIALLIVGTSIRCGFACGFTAGAGAATADLAYALVAAGAGAAVATRLAPWDGTVRLVSAMALVLIAVWGLWGLRKPGGEAFQAGPSRADLVGTYTRFFGLTAVNPLTVVYFTALVLGSGVVVGGTGPTLAFAIGAFVASLSWQTLLAAVGGLGRRGLSPRGRLVAAATGNLVILGLALDIATNR